MRCPRCVPGCRLWHEGHVVVIDVSQSVEKEHPRALEFLRMDCQNATDYFRRSGVVVMTPRELFDYVVHAALATPEEERAYIEEVSASSGQAGRPGQGQGRGMGGAAAGGTGSTC